MKKLVLILSFQTEKIFFHGLAANRAVQGAEHHVLRDFADFRVRDVAIRRNGDKAQRLVGICKTDQGAKVEDAVAGRSDLDGTEALLGLRG